MGGKVIGSFCVYLCGNWHSFVYCYRAQIGLLFILLIAIGDYIVGSLIGPKNDSDLSKGFVGFSCKLLLVVKR